MCDYFFVFVSLRAARGVVFFICGYILCPSIYLSLLLASSMTACHPSSVIMDRGVLTSVYYFLTLKRLILPHNPQQSQSSRSPSEGSGKEQAMIEFIYSTGVVNIS